MNLLKKPDRSSFPWFTVGMAGVLLLSFGLHFWGLDRFNTLVFDEVYYVKYANNYLTRTPFFDAHPPLGKYAIALAIWIGSHFQSPQDAVNNLGGVPFSPWTYRWLNALVGSLLPFVVGAIAYHISHRRSYALIAALFTTLDGLFLVESRYALINIYLVFFGLLGQWFFLVALEHQHPWRWFWLALSGLGFGACISVKWNGLGFLVGIYLIWIFAKVMQWMGRDIKNLRLPFPNLTQIKFYHFLANLAILPAILYYLVWIPHLQINTKTGFWGLHKQILGFHQGLGSGASVHPYCSSWYTWPLMLRPMSYFYETARNTTEPVPSFGPALPAGAGKVIYDIHAMGNPFLWWLSTAAIVLLLIQLASHIWLFASRNTEPISRSQSSRSQVRTSRSQVQPGNDFLEDLPRHFTGIILGIKQSPKLWIALYLMLNYAANFLPWIKVTRCTFIYLYMPAAIFGFLTIAWLVERWLYSCDIEFRLLGVTVIFIIVLAFLFWLPVYLGLPLSSEGFRWRIWLGSWY